MTCSCGPNCPCCSRRRVAAAVIAAALLALGLLGAGYLTSTTLIKARQANTTVTVKGLAERQVKADLAIWQVSFTATDNDLIAAYDTSRTNENALATFLGSKGIRPEDIKPGSVKVTDLLANEYGARDLSENTQRYILRTTVSVRAQDVAAVDAAARAVPELVKQGLVLTSSALDYQFTKLNDIKVDMLREATASARAAADQFAKDSGSAVGALQTANQGYFSVVSADAASQSDSESTSTERASTIDKTVRVVVNFTYFLNSK